MLDSLILPVTNAEAMSVFLKEVSERYPDEFIFMFADGPGWHRGADLRVPGNIRLVSLPPYSPELNLAEHLWDEIREKWFANVVFQDMEGVEDRLLDALIALENDPDRVQGLTGFDWIVSCLTNAT